MTRKLLLILALACCLFGQSTIGNGTKVVTTAGTRVTLVASTTLATWVTVQALTSNTGSICIGGSTVLAASKNGVCLTAGQAHPFYARPDFVPYDLSTINIDSTVNGEGVGFDYAR